MLVSVDLADAYTDAVREAISSGLRTTFTYDVELRMMVPVWVDRTIATSVVSTSDQYDNLTRRHSLSRLVDGRVDEALVTEDEAVAQKWLTSLNRLPLCRTSKLETNRDYYVRIRARAAVEQLAARLDQRHQRPGQVHLHSLVTRCSLVRLFLRRDPPCRWL